MSTLITIIKTFFGSISDFLSDSLSVIRSFFGLLSQAWSLRLTLFDVIPSVIVGIVVAGMSIATAKILLKR